MRRSRVNYPIDLSINDQTITPRRVLWQETAAAQGFASLADWIRWVGDTAVWEYVRECGGVERAGRRPSKSMYDSRNKNIERKHHGD